MIERCRRLWWRLTEGPGPFGWIWLLRWRRIESRLPAAPLVDAFDPEPWEWWHDMDDAVDKDHDIFGDGE